VATLRLRRERRQRVRARDCELGCALKRAEHLLRTPLETRGVRRGSRVVCNAPTSVRRRNALSPQRKKKLNRIRVGRHPRGNP